MSSLNGAERYEKRFRIGVRFDGSKFVLQDGQPLPALAMDSVAELVLAPESILDENIRARLSGRETVHFLNAGSSVLVGISPSMIDNYSLKGLILARDIPIISQYVFVEVRLEGELRLYIRGDQEARLASCACTIPALERGAKSLNHAATLISEAYETLRSTHSVNALKTSYTRLESGEWVSLAELRVSRIMAAISKR